MGQRIEFAFSHSFEGIIWNTLADGNNQRLFIEVRDVARKQVLFSALDLRHGQWLWKNTRFEEDWWISLGEVAGDILLLTLYTDTNNPDRKSLIAYEVSKKQMLWWRNGFTVSASNSRYVSGVDAKYPDKPLLLDLFNGEPVDQVDFHLDLSQNFPVIRPFQYEQDTAYFNTVRDFLKLKCDITPVATIEYLELDSLIFTSVFVKEKELANYLYVFDRGGEKLLSETLGKDLKGVGLDTFFVFSGHLIFVKNKNELLSYKIV